MLRSILSFFLLLVLLQGHPNAAMAQVFEKKTELHGDIVVMPIMIINVYPFIPGSVNGVSGKFMFDTGLKPAISLNDNFVVVANKKIQGSGQAGSGQSFNTSLTDTLQELKFTNGLTFRNLINVRSANYDFLQQHIATDFLGFVGHDFFSGYLFKLDYLHKNVTFYKNSKARSLSKDYLANEKILAVIEFEIKKMPNMPIINIKIDNVNVLGTFDTGQNGFLQLDSISEQRLLKSRTVTASGKDSAGDVLLTVRNIRFNSKLHTSLKGLERSSLQDTNVIRKAGNLTAANLMTIGYRFFSQYKTVWDYDNRKIYVLEY